MPPESKVAPEESAGPEQIRSTVDICLWKTETLVPEQNTFAGSTSVRIEKRAWVCPLCSQSTEYYLVNDCIVKGLGMRTHYVGRLTIDYCQRPACEMEAHRRIDAETLGETTPSPDRP